MACTLKFNRILLGRKLYGTYAQNGLGKSQTFEYRLKNASSPIDLALIAAEMIAPLYQGYKTSDGEIIKNIVNTVATKLTELGTPLDDNFNTEFENIISKIYFEPEQEVENNKGREPDELGKDDPGSKSDALEQSRRQQLSTLFSKVQGAFVSVPAKFKANIIEHAFINLDAGKFVTSTLSSFNRSILSYQGELFNTVASYLINQGYKIVNDQLYVGEGLDGNVAVINPDANNIMQLAWDHIQKQMNLMVDDNLSEHDRAVKSGWGSEQQENFGRRGGKLYSTSDLQYYRFVEAWFNLQYFDDSLEQSFGDSIIFNPNQRNVFVSKVVDGAKTHYKYSAGKDKRGRYTGFTDDNKRNGFTEQGRFSVALLESLPLHSYNKYATEESNTKRQGQYINQIRVTTAFSHLYDAVLKGKVVTSAVDKTSEKKDFIRAVLDLHSNPKHNISTILDVLFNGKNYTDAKVLQSLQAQRVLTENEIDTLYSLWKNVYNTESDEKTGHSILKLENASRSKYFARTSYIYSDCISGLVDRVTELKYLSVQYDEYSGELKINLRKKYSDNSTRFRVRDKVNNFVDSMLLADREALRTKYKFKIHQAKDKSGQTVETYTVSLGGLTLRLNPNKEANKNSYSILNAKENVVEIKKDNKYMPIDDFFKGVDLMSKEVMNELITKDGDLYKVLTFISDSLGMPFNTDEATQILHLYKLNALHMFEDLASGAIRAMYFNQILEDFEKSGEDSLPKFLIKKDSPYREVFNSIGTITGGVFSPNSTANIMYQIGDDFKLLTVPETSPWIDGYSDALAMFNGDSLKSTSKNFSGNSEQNGRTNHLGAQLQHYIQKIQDDAAAQMDTNAEGRAPKRIAAAKLLFAASDSTRRLITGQLMSSDIKAKDGTVKSIKSLKNAELLFTKIFHSFYGIEGSKDTELGGNIAMQPTVYSDKGSIIDYLLSTEKFKFDGHEYSLKNLTDSEVTALLLKTVGAYYDDIAANTVDDYTKIFTYPGTREEFGLEEGFKFTSIKEINYFFKNHPEISETNLTVLAQKAGVILEKESQYTIYQGKIRMNPLLYWYTTELYGDKSAGAAKLKARLDDERIEFLNSIIRSNLFIQTDDTAVKQALSSALGDKAKTWVKTGSDEEDGILIIAKIHRGKKVENITQGSEINPEGLVINNPDAENWIEINPVLNNYFNAYSVTGINLRLLLTGSDLAHTLNKTAAFSKEGKGLLIKELQKVGISFADLGFASIDDAMGADFIEIADKIEHLAPRKKSIASKVYTREMISLQSIAGTEGGQLKRNVIIPATLQYIQQGAINSLPKKVKVAVLSDIAAHVNTFAGETKTIDSQDGSALINPFFSILENLGLQDQAVGVDKKPIWHHYNNALGTATLLKYATFTMTNMRMLQSLRSDTELYNLFKKMTNLQWKDKSGKWLNSQGAAIDLVNGKKFGFKSDGVTPSTKIDFNRDIKQRERLFYGLNQNIREINNFDYEKFEGIGDSIYYTEESSINLDGTKRNAFTVYHLFDDEGNHYRLSREEVIARKSEISRGKLHTINSLFELHSAMGGVFSLEQKDGVFITSERSNEVVVNFMNIVGNANSPQITDKTRTERTGSSAAGGATFKTVPNLTQDEYFQPLKEMMIGVAANTTAMKNGQANVNPASSWRDNTALTYTELDTDGYGMQQDADHEADNAEMSEPTQVMTALDQGGFLHKYVRQIYKSVGRVTLSATRIEINAVEDFLTKYAAGEPNAINKLYDIVGRTVLNNMSSNAEEMDLSEEILDEIKKGFGIKSDNHELDDLKIAFSDPSIYGHVLPTIISTLNSKGIRRKNPGSGMVMVPAYGIFQTFKYKGNIVTLSDILRDVNLDQDSVVKENKVTSLVNDQLTAKAVTEKIQALLQAEQDTYAKTGSDDYDLGDIVNVYGLTDEPIVITLDSVPKYYSFKHKRWLDFSSANVHVLKAGQLLGLNSASEIDEYIKAGGVNGLQTFVANAVAAGLNTVVGDTILNDKTMQLYNALTHQYQENIMKSRDLAPTRIQFTEEIGGVVRKRTFYDIPFIEKAFTEKSKIDNKTINTLFADLSRGYYYENYELDTNKKLVGVGEKHVISNLKYYKPQAIVSNMWASKFNGAYYQTLQQIRNTTLFNVDSFKESIKEYPNQDSTSEMRFLKANGSHTYIAFSKIGRADNNRRVQFQKERLNNFRKEKMVINGRNVYSTIALDSNNFDIMEVGRQVERKDLSLENGKIMQGDKVYEHTENLAIIDGIVYQNFNLVNKYQYKHDGKVDQMYSIDYDAIKEMVNTTEGSEQDAIALVGELAETIYSGDSYIAFDHRLKEEHSQLIGTWKGKKATGVVGLLGSRHSDIAEYAKNIINKKDASLDKILEQVQREVQTSFLQSQQIIAARIPSQSLQSFMPMEIVGYSQMETNVAYVSHIQTFLQGSDYDIDKSYILTYFFDDNGRFIKWSPLMSLDSKEVLDESIKIAVPNGTQLATTGKDLDYNFADVTTLNRKRGATKNAEDKARLDSEAKALEQFYRDSFKSAETDITNLLLNVKNATTKAEKIRHLGELIDYVDQNSMDIELKKKGETPVFFYKYDERISKEDAEQILDLVRQHEDYVIPEAIREKAYQNANSSKISIIIQDWHNINSAHTPINMNDAQNTTSRRQGRTTRMTLMNPGVIAEMQVENQTGRNVIGIAANGEKAFFTLYYYFTECYSKLLADSKNLSLLQHLSFTKKFSRIEGRWDADDPKNKKLSDSHPDKKHIHEVTKTRIANLNESITGKSDEEIKFEVDQMISQLLSAATDNAKELILKKINAGEEFAKIYFYCLVLGFSLDDIAAFMTSPAIDLLAGLSESNMFDTHNNKVTPAKILGILQYGNYDFQGYLGNVSFQLNKVLSSGHSVTTLDGKTVTIKSLNEWCLLKNQGLIDGTFYNFVASLEGKQYSTSGDEIHTVGHINKVALIQLSEYIEGTSAKIENAIEKSGGLGNFNADLAEFKNLWDMSNEMTTFTNVYLNTNQGLPTTLDKYIKRLIAIQNTVRTREKDLTLRDDKGKVVESVEKAIKADDPVGALVKIMQRANPQYVGVKVDPDTGKVVDGNGVDYYTYIAQKALDQDIPGNFSYDKWLTSEEYRKATMDYYNTIKGTFNIFHFLKIHPQYNANFKLFAPSYVMATKTNLKTKLILAAQAKFQEEEDFWDSKKNEKLKTIADEVIMRRFLEDSNLILKIDPSWQILNEAFDVVNGHGKTDIKLDTGIGFSNFKYLMETYIIPSLKGTLSKDLAPVIVKKGKETVSISDNAFIKGIEKAVKFNRPYLTLDIDMSARKVSADTNIKFEEYSQAFQELASYKLPSLTMDGNPLTVQDLIVLYNLIVNHNQYGSDRFTGIFKSTISRNNKNSLLYKYLRYIGEADHKSYQVKADDLNLLIRDMQISMAPTVSKFKLNYSEDKFVKVREHGLTTLYERQSTGDYKVAKVFLNEFGDVVEPNSRQSINFMQYACLFSTQKDGIEVSSARVADKSPNIVLEGLRNLIANNKMFIISNC